MDKVNIEADARAVWRHYFQEASGDMPVKRYLALVAMAGAVVLCIIALLGPAVGNVVLSTR